jgi:hypothetical protein
MFELELELLDKQIGDLEVARSAAAMAADEIAILTIDERLERLWKEVRRFCELESRFDFAGPEERVRLVGLPN